jgi:uncharacterized Zn-finger protein
MMLNLSHTNTERASSSDDTLGNSMVSELIEEKENIPLCHYCRKSFANYSNLRHHIQIVHLKESKWDCSKCGKVNSLKDRSIESVLSRIDLLVQIEFESSLSNAYSREAVHL